MLFGRRCICRTAHPPARHAALRRPGSVQAHLFAARRRRSRPAHRCRRSALAPGADAIDPNVQAAKSPIASRYADNTFFSAQQVQLKLKFLPLLRGRFEVTELVLDKPIFNLLKQADGSFNYADIASKKTPAGTRREVRKKTDGGKKVEAIAAGTAQPHARPRRPDQSRHQRPNAGQYQGHRAYRCKKCPAKRHFPFAIAFQLSRTQKLSCSKANSITRKKRRCSSSRITA